MRRRSGANSPPPLDSAAYAADFAEFAATGGVASSERMGDPVSFLLARHLRYWLEPHHAFRCEGERPSPLAKRTALCTGQCGDGRQLHRGAKENAESRIYAGIHFNSATEAGLKLGQSIGRYVLDTYLTVTE